MAPLSRGLRVTSSLLARTTVMGARRISSKHLVFTPEVKAALANHEPLVTLESTIITHGMPHPTNLEMAVEVEQLIRDQGAVPATVALIGGRVHVGLLREQLVELAEGSRPAIKTSRRDVPYVLANQCTGGTTVSGTMLVSHLAGIQVFVTGGIGGVHRGAAQSMDISADLTELGRTPVSVVCAGVKSILDIGLTLEYLETQGVCVATLCDQGSRGFPSFYSRDSGHRAPYNLNSREQAARLVHSREVLGLESGILIAVPIPESEAAAGETIESAIQQALQEAEEEGVVGREVTPFILARLNQLTGGESLRANLALVKNNAREGAGVAVELAKIKNKEIVLPPAPVSSSSSVVVVGGCNYDFVVRISDQEIALDGGTLKGCLRSSHGGVGHNLAVALARLTSDPPSLVSAVGEDEQGSSILRGVRGLLDTKMVLVDKGMGTATYTAVLDGVGDCKFGVGDMAIHSRVSPEYVRGLEEQLARAPLVVVDGNMSTETIHSLLEVCSKHTVPVFFDPADLHKATKPLASPLHSAMTYCSPNLRELQAMLSTLPDQVIVDTEVGLDTPHLEAAVRHIAVATEQLMKHYRLQVVLVTMSECGVLVVRRGSHSSPLPLTGGLSSDDTEELRGVWYPGTPCPPAKVVSVSGAGDCLSSGFIAGVLRGLDQDQAVSAGLQAARISCEVSAAVPDSLSPSTISWHSRATGRLVLGD